jgi:hypothetical protein
MLAYKLVRKLKSGKLTPLFINKSLGIELNTWYESECLPTKGFKVRQGWHCTPLPIAPHLSKKNRVWVKVEIQDVTEYQRPESQGGLWYTANRIKFLEVLSIIQTRILSKRSINNITSREM